ncbi:hypothetical protein TWF694_010035 [Orbilia ellipsospora]|uniref:Alcohol acetyltransferase n=1 Tax=Orbilia ellipsospora TaxID=2528407 RepID=A0AAV9X8N5_9PEZI
MEGSPQFALLRECSNLENYYFLISAPGSQSSIVVAAKYGNINANKKLSKDKVIRALSKVIERQPALGMTVVRQPPKKKGKDMLWYARRSTIVVEDYINFVNVEDKDPGETSRRMILEILSDWFDPTDSSRPLWRITVVNMETVYFAFNHIICDGKSGYFFHREFLSALNDDEISLTQPVPTSVSTSEGYWPDMHGESVGKYYRHNVISFLLGFILQMIIEGIFFPKYMVYKDVKMIEHKPSLKQLAPVEERITNSMASVRIDSETMKRIITLCRSNKTSFTAFFDTLLNVCLCADAYPDALLTRVSMVADVRGMCDYKHGEILSNMAGSLTKIRRTAPFAAIGKPPKGKEVGKETVYTDVVAFWKMASYRKEQMNKYLKNGVIQEGLSLRLAPRYIDDYPERVYSTLHTTRSFGSLISNLGVLTPRDEDKDREWQFKAADWASSTVRSSAGQALNICIASVPDADCVINLGWEEGTYGPDVIPNLAKNMQTRIGQVVGDESAGVTVRY